MARYGFIVAAWLVLTAACSSTPLVAGESAELSEELLAKARDLVKSWERPAPRLEFSEKWRVSLPIGEFAPVVSAAESDRLAVLTAASEVMVLDANDGRELARFKGKAEDRSDCPGAKGAPRCIAITPDGKHVAIGCTDGVLIWNWSQDKVDFVHTVPNGGVTEVRISGNGQQIAFADLKKNIASYPVLGGAGFGGHTTSGLGNTFHIEIDYGGGRLLYRNGRLQQPLEAILDQNRSPDKWPDSYRVGPEDSVSMAAGNAMRAVGNRDGEFFVVEAAAPNTSSYWTRVDLPFDHLHKVYVSRDDQLAMATSSGGEVAMRRAQGVNGLWIGVIPEIRIRTVKSDFQSLLATSRRPGDLIRYDLKPLAPHPGHEMEMWLHDALERRAFDEIDAVFAAVTGNGVFAFSPHSTRFELLASLFDLSISPLEKRTRLQALRKEWLDKEPRRAGAAYVLGLAQVRAAWDARGSGPGFSVTEEGHDEFQKQLMNAHDVLDPFFSGDKPPPVELYVPWFTVGKGGNWPPNVMRVRISEFVNRIDRWVQACDSVAAMLLPRWHGDEDDARQFAAMVRDKVGGPAGKGAYARIAASLFDYHLRDVWVQNQRPPGDPTPTLGFDFPETKAGLLHVLENEPAHPEFIKNASRIATAFSDIDLARAVLRRKERELRGEIVGVAR